MSASVLADAVCMEDSRGKCGNKWDLRKQATLGANPRLSESFPSGAWDVVAPGGRGAGGLR